VEHELLRRQCYQSVSAGISRRRGAEHYGNEGRERTGVCNSRPRNKILDVLALSGGENRKEESGRRLSPIARSRDNPERATSDPAATSLVAEGRAPAAATNYLSGRAAAVGDRPSADNEKDAGAVVEGVIHRDQAVGVYHHFLG
jgi:nucleoid-associated protein YgaU